MIAHGRYLANHIEGARFIALPGGDTAIDESVTYPLVDEVANILLGERPSREVDRILTTVLFTDIVGSTQMAATLGDRRWRVVLDSHDKTVRDQLR